MEPPALADAMKASENSCAVCGRILVEGGLGSCPGCKIPELDLAPVPATGPEREASFVRSHQAAMKQPEPAPTIPFPKAFLSAFAYPVSRLNSVLFMVIAVPFLDHLRFFALGPTMIITLAGFAILAAFVASWFFRILVETHEGSDVVPGVLNLSEPGDFIVKGLRYGAAHLIAYWPVLLFWWICGDAPWGFPVVGLLNFIGALYLPMALLLIGFGGRWVSGLSYPFGVRSMFRCFRDYFICALFFQVTRHLSVGLAYLAMNPRIAVGKVVIWNISPEISPWIHLLGTGLGLYLGAVQMRVLGLFARSNHEQLGWFRRGP